MSLCHHIHTRTLATEQPGRRAADAISLFLLAAGLAITKRLCCGSVCTYILPSYVARPLHGMAWLLYGVFTILARPGMWLTLLDWIWNAAACRHQQPSLGRDVAIGKLGPSRVATPRCMLLQLLMLKAGKKESRQIRGPERARDL